MDDYLELLEYLRADKGQRSYADIAASTGVPISTIRSILDNAHEQYPRVITVHKLLGYYRAERAGKVAA